MSRYRPPRTRSWCEILASHLKSEHDMESDEEELTELVESEAYEAMDS